MIVNCQDHACTSHDLKRDIKQSWILTSSPVILPSFSKRVLKAHRSSHFLVCSAWQIALTLLYGHLQFNKWLGLWLISFGLKTRNLYKTWGYSTINLFNDGLWKVEGGILVLVAVHADLLNLEYAKSFQKILVDWPLKRMWKWFSSYIFTKQSKWVKGFIHRVDMTSSCLVFTVKIR